MIVLSLKCKITAVIKEKSKSAIYIYIYKYIYSIPSLRFPFLKGTEDVCRACSDGNFLSLCNFLRNNVNGSAYMSIKSFVIYSIFYHRWHIAAAIFWVNALFSPVYTYIILNYKFFYQIRMSAYIVRVLLVETEKRELRYFQRRDEQGVNPLHLLSHPYNFFNHILI